MTGKTCCNPTLHPLLWMMVSISVFLASMDVVSAAEKKAAKEEEDRFGEIFIHPRDRHYQPGSAPSRAERQSVENVLDPERGAMTRYEYQKGDTTIYRDVWDEPGFGSRGSFGLKFKF